MEKICVLTYDSADKWICEKKPTCILHKHMYIGGTKNYLSKYFKKTSRIWIELIQIMQNLSKHVYSSSILFDWFVTHEELLLYFVNN
jgi:hypothetical protein